MAHTDRDNERWARRHHDCPNNGYPWHGIALCLVCEGYHPNYWCSTDGKSQWNKAERQAERGKAKQALRSCRDYDSLSIKYRRPYWD